ncbi:hypothetical protein M408DRAFT_210583, partial [Serendipita vermifera MAFF 305830]
MPISLWNPFDLLLLSPHRTCPKAAVATSKSSRVSLQFPMSFFLSLFAPINACRVAPCFLSLSPIVMFIGRLQRPKCPPKTLLSLSFPPSNFVLPVIPGLPFVVCLYLPTRLPPFLSPPGLVYILRCHRLACTVVVLFKILFPN